MAAALSKVTTCSLEVGGARIDYRVVKSARRRKTIQISLRHEAGVTVHAPLRTSDASIRALVLGRAGWIVTRLGELANVVAAPLSSRGELPFLGRTLHLDVAAGHEDAVAMDGGTLRAVLTPGGNPPAESRLRYLVTGWYMSQAEDVLREATTRWGERMGLAPRRIIVKDQRRRWGSCGPDGTLRFNWRLVMADRLLIDLIVVHELAHLRHRNHAQAFWAEVSRFIPDVAERRRRFRLAAASLVL